MSELFDHVVSFRFLGIISINLNTSVILKEIFAEILGVEKALYRCVQVAGVTEVVQALCAFNMRVIMMDQILLLSKAGTKIIMASLRLTPVVLS